MSPVVVGAGLGGGARGALEVAGLVSDCEVTLSLAGAVQGRQSRCHGDEGMNGMAVMKALGRWDGKITHIVPVYLVVSLQWVLCDKTVSRDPLTSRMSICAVTTLR